jgi:hypothetical protein
MVIFGIALAGLCPLVVMQLKVIRRIESQGVGAGNPQVIRGVRMIGNHAYMSLDGTSGPPPTILLPQPDAWVRRLSVSASFSLARTQDQPNNPPLPTQSYTGPLPTQSATTDDVDAGFSSSISWTTSPGGGAVGVGYRSLPANSTTAGPATWTFSGLTPGAYTVMASYVPDTQNASDATYTFTDGLGNAVTKVVNQKASPTDAPPYTSLGVFYLGASPQFQLNFSTTGRVVADSIQLVPAGPINAVTVTTPATTTAGVSLVYVKVVGP